MRRRGECKRREGERGFALLLVFVLAAAIALMLYRQMPRAAFESERDKEQLLIDRGAQYQRAIQLYFVTFKRYPARIEDLENTNDHRFLRKRYLDPYTGKAEWRLIHTNGLTLTDSKVQPAPNPNGNGNGNGTGTGTGTGSSTAGTAPGTGANTGSFSTSTQTSSNTSSTNGAQAAPPAVNSTVAARPSDRSLPTNASYNSSSAGVYNAVQNNQPYTPPNYNDPAQFPPISLYPNGYNANQPGQPNNGNGALNQPGFNPNQPGLNQAGLNQPGLNQPGVNPNQPGAFIPPTMPPGLTNPGLPAGMSMPGLPTGLNQPGLNQPGLNQPGLNQAGLNQAGFNQPPNSPGTPPVYPNGVATSPDGSQQVQIPQQFPGQQLPGQQFPGQQFPGQQFPGQQPVQPNFPQQGFPQQGFPQQGLPQQVPVQQQPGQYIPPTNNPSLPGAPGAANPGLNIINQLLTTPRPAPAGIGAATNNQTVGGGIAGVASTFSGGTIKSYGGRMDYSEWEFVYQLPQQQGLPPNVPGSQTPNGAPQNTPSFPGGSPGVSPGGMPPLGSPPGPAPTSIPSPPAGGFPAIPSLPPH